MAKESERNFSSPFRVVWCVWLREIAISKLWQDGLERENLHNKPFCMQTSQRCQLKPMEQFIKFTSHYWKTCSRVAEPEKKARWHIIYWHIVYNQWQQQPRFSLRENLGRLCRHRHCTYVRMDDLSSSETSLCALRVVSKSDNFDSASLLNSCFDP